MAERYLDVTQGAGAALFRRQIPGELIMLNLLRFREVADYSSNPELAPAEPISGREAYQKYIDHTLPFLTESGGEIMLLGDGGKYLIGPDDEQWDVVMIVRQKSPQDFMAFSTNEAYKKGLGHRTAALEDSRLLPIVEIENNNLL
ncbi:MAG: DUF1330 domain-containing protein [Anaerolineae bacterium]